ncbi:hypothetical protein AB0N05_22070 [Nocardia sp. NPDC051030]|uniref:DUF7373 family lipoprotein n=1 Tax=Nocardia sp. NPDC051030 TaxID=3155162 RepID=UPI00342D1504
MNPYRNSLRRAVPAALAMLTAALLGGCGSTVPGTTVAAEIDVRTLDVGSFPTEPLEYRTAYYADTDKGAELAAMRLAGYVPDGIEIDPNLAYGRYAKAIWYPSQLSYLLAEVDTPIVERNNMLFGFAMSAASSATGGGRMVQHDVNTYDDQKPPTDQTSVNLTVLQFPDAESARRSATEIEAADFAVAADANTPVSFDAYPDAKAHWRQGIPTLGSTIAHGNYLVNVFVTRPDSDLGALKELTQKALALQLPLLDQLPPLSAREVLHLDSDPQAMQRRTLHEDGYISPDLEEEATFTPRGFLHTVEQQAKWRQMTDARGVDAIAQIARGALMLRARDGDAGSALLEDFRTLAKDKIDGPPGLPDAFCQQFPPESGSNFYICTVRYGRYVARVTSTQLQDAQQRANAQYALLANSSWM